MKEMSIFETQLLSHLVNRKYGTGSFPFWLFQENMWGGGGGGGEE